MNLYYIKSKNLNKSYIVQEESPDQAINILINYLKPELEQLEKQHGDFNLDLNYKLIKDPVVDLKKLKELYG